ncbi:MAG: flagellar basal-body rod protein FlgF [Leptospiraceae bacterium]|nr:flagellar basal-body rod protein FlgF [Leptospiraceae bacterium]
MDRLIYVAMNGAKQIEMHQATNAHNLANANTTGFKGDFDRVGSLLVYGDGYPSRVYSIDERSGINLTSGQIVQTGRDLDIAVSGDGYIAVQAPDGSEAYTRAGDLRVTTGGILETGTGLAVLGNGGPIALPPFEKLDIGADGTLSIVPVGQDASSLAIVDRIKLVNPSNDQLQKSEDGLLRASDNSTFPPDASVHIASGALESSNVNTVNEMVQMIELARKFEMHVKVLETARENDVQSSSILRLGR